MTDKTGISWCTRTNNAQRGCSHARRRGCDQCYGARFASNPWFGGTGKPYDGLACNEHWTGEVRFIPEALLHPLGWRKPEIIFWDSMSDIGHEKVEPWQRAAQFGVAAATKRHLHLFLTKRPHILGKWFADLGTALQGRYAGPACAEVAAKHLLGEPKIANRLYRAANEAVGVDFPAPNILLGTSLSGPEDIDQIETLLKIPAAGYFLSAEPLLEETRIPNALLKRLSLIIVGAESGPRRRPCPIEAVRSLVHQAEDAGVGVHVKQIEDVCGFLIDDPAEFPADLRIREMPKRLNP